MRKQRGEVVIGSIVFALVLLFMGTAAVKSGSSKAADSEQVKVAEAQK